MGHHDGDERGQGVHVPAGAAGDVDRLAVQQTIADRRGERAGPGRGRRHATVAGAVRPVLGGVAVHVRAHRVRRVHHVPRRHRLRVLHGHRVRHDCRVQRVDDGAATDVRVPVGRDPDVRPEHQRPADHRRGLADVPRPVGRPQADGRPPDARPVRRHHRRVHHVHDRRNRVLRVLAVPVRHQSLSRGRVPNNRLFHQRGVQRLLDFRDNPHDEKLQTRGWHAFRW